MCDDDENAIMNSPEMMTPFVVAFMETEYTADESARSVEVCVKLLRPTFKIGRENNYHSVCH
jgi:hypothetical protein